MFIKVLTLKNSIGCSLKKEGTQYIVVLFSFCYERQKSKHKLWYCNEMSLLLL